MVLARNLLQHSADNEAETFAIFQEGPDRCVDPLHREEILFHVGIQYIILTRWNHSIEALHQLCFSSTRPDGMMLPQVNEAMIETYIEQYCTNNTLDIDQRTEILCHVKTYLQAREISTQMHFIRVQLFYFNGDKHEAYRHLELYLDHYLAEYKLR